MDTRCICVSVINNRDSDMNRTVAPRYLENPDLHRIMVYTTQRMASRPLRPLALSARDLASLARHGEICPQVISALHTDRLRHPAEQFNARRLETMENFRVMFILLGSAFAFLLLSFIRLNLCTPPTCFIISVS